MNRPISLLYYRLIRPLDKGQVLACKQSAFVTFRVNFVVMELKMLSPSLLHWVFYKSTPNAAGIIIGLVLEVENKQDGSLSCKPELGVLFLFPWLSKLHWELMENWLCLSHSLRLVTRPPFLFVFHQFARRPKRRMPDPFVSPSEPTLIHIWVIVENHWFTQCCIFTG